MNIFKAEASVDGLAEQVLAKRSVAYSSEIRPWTPTERETFQREQLSQAFQAAAKVHNRSIGGAFDLDLYFTKSILVSTNWNKNDDVFAPEPVWAARHTPSHKRTNIDHDETSLVGHITETWALDGDGNLIPDNTVIDDLPELFHLANGAVIYTKWEDDDLVNRTSELIGQIEAGKKFVSMEALFSNFDYAIVTPEEKYHIVARGQDTAFLTKHLKIYGGSGMYDGCSVGRLLRNITFSGKGYVDKPANPYSVIFNNAKAFDYSTASTKNPFLTKTGVSISCSSTSSDNQNGEKSMSDTISVDLLKSQNDDLKQSVASLNDKVEKLTKLASEAGVKSLEGQVEDLGGRLEATEKERDDANANIVTLTSEKEVLGTQLTEANEAKEALEKVATEAKIAKTQADRIASLVDGGVDKKVATSKVEAFTSLDDDQFAVIAVDIIAAAKVHDKKDDDKKDDKKDSKGSDKSSDDESQDSADADPKTLDEAEASDDGPAMSADASGDDTDETKLLRTELRMALAHSIGHDVEDEDDKDSE